MDKGAYRSRARHRIRQPDEQRDLCALPGRTQKEQQRYRTKDAELSRRCLESLRNRFEHFVEIDAAEILEDEEDPKQKPKVSNTVYDERLFCSVSRHSDTFLGPGTATETGCAKT